MCWRPRVARLTTVRRGSTVLDAAFVSSGRSELHEIACGHDVPLVSAQRPKQCARCAHVKRAVGGFHGADQPVNRKHATALDRGFVDIEQDAKARLLGGSIDADHGTLAGQITLAADAFLLNGILLGVRALGVKTSGPFVRAYPRPDFCEMWLESYAFFYRPLTGRAMPPVVI